MPLTNSQIKLIRSLQLKKKRLEEGLFVVEGIKLIKELIAHNSFEIHSLFSTESIGDIDFTKVTKKELERISYLKNANTCLAVVKIPAPKNNFENQSKILIVDSINDPGNLGTIIRTADWFGISELILSENSVDLYNPKVVQSTMGAIFRVNISYCPLVQIFETLKKMDFSIHGACMDGEDYRAIDKKSKIALVMGSESHGIHPELIKKLDKQVTIPRIGKSESLNLGVATGILLAAYTS